MSENDQDRDVALAVVDQALASGRVTAADPAERELQELVLAIDAESPLPDEDFVRLLDVRVAEGFPKPERRTPRGRRPPLLRGRGLALTGAAASLLVVIGVALGLSTQNDETPTSALDDQLTSPAPVSPQASGGPEDLLAQSQAGASELSAIAPREPNRRIERSAQLTLAAPNDKLDSVADSIVRVTDRHGGFVLSSSVATGDESPGGRFDLRVPADSLQPALRDLSRLGHVRARSQAGQDVTPAFVSAQDRFDAARAERRSLLRRLENSTSDRQANRIRNRLDFVSQRVDRWRRTLRDLRERTNYSAVTVTLAEDSRNGGGAGATREAFDDGLGLLEGSLNFALRAFGVLIPLGAAGGIAWLGARILRRRRREAVLQ